MEKCVEVIGTFIDMFNFFEAPLQCIFNFLRHR